MIDFDQLYKSKSNFLKNKWFEVTKKILKLAEKSRNSDVKACLAKYNQFIDTGGFKIRIHILFNISTSIKVIIILIIFFIDREPLVGFLLLPLLLAKPAFKAARSEKKFDPTKEFIQKSFIFYAETHDEVREFIAQKTEFYASYKLSHQPYVIVYESDNGLVSSVRINEVIYNLESPELAIDCCFKTFYSLDAEFPKESRHVWNFLARFIYEFKIDNLSTLVLTFIEELKKTKCD